MNGLKYWNWDDDYQIELKALEAEIGEPTDQEKKEMAQAYRERAKEDLEMADAMAGGPVIRDLKSRLAKAQDSVALIRDSLYDALPSGEVDAFELINAIKVTLNALDSLGKTLGRVEKVKDIKTTEYHNESIIDPSFNSTSKLNYKKSCVGGEDQK